jgi:hypothetical protein
VVVKPRPPDVSAGQVDALSAFNAGAGLVSKRFLGAGVIQDLPNSRGGIDIAILCCITMRNSEILRSGCLLIIQRYRGTRYVARIAGKLHFGRKPFGVRVRNGSYDGCEAAIWVGSWYQLSVHYSPPFPSALFGRRLISDRAR